MSQADETRKTVLAYFNAWTAKRPDEAFTLLADDLAFWAQPTATPAPHNSVRGLTLLPR
jgi:hypothetical protein